MTPEQAIAAARSDKLRPVYLVLGEERFLVDRVVSAVREATQKGGIAGFNEDKFTAGEADAGAIVAAARMLPMMAPKRFVLVRGLERWEKKGDDSDEGDAPAKAGKKAKAGKSPLDELAEYAQNPSPSTVMILLAPKLHAQRRLVTGAKKGGYVVNCDALSRKALPGWISSEAKARGHTIAPDVADLLAEIAGPELGYVKDALDRLSLYVGPKQAITEDAVATMVARVRRSTVWELLDVLGKRKLADALGMLPEVFDARDGGLPVLGAIAWTVRNMAKFESALRSGLDESAAASQAGVPPFKARDMAQSIRSYPPGTLSRWLRLLAEADLALKGSRRSPQAVLETMVIEMCKT